MVFKKRVVRFGIFRDFKCCSLVDEFLILVEFQ